MGGVRGVPEVRFEHFEHFKIDSSNFKKNFKQFKKETNCKNLKQVIEATKNLTDSMDKPEQVEYLSEIRDRLAFIRDQYTSTMSGINKLIEKIFPNIFGKTDEKDELDGLIQNLDDKLLRFGKTPNIIVSQNYLKDQLGQVRKDLHHYVYVESENEVAGLKGHDEHNKVQYWLENKTFRKEIKKFLKVVSQDSTEDPEMRMKNFEREFNNFAHEMNKSLPEDYKIPKKGGWQLALRVALLADKEAKDVNQFILHLKGMVEANPDSRNIRTFNEICNVVKSCVGFDPRGNVMHRIQALQENEVFKEQLPLFVDTLCYSDQIDTSVEFQMLNTDMRNYQDGINEQLPKSLRIDLNNSTHRKIFLIAALRNNKDRHAEFQKKLKKMAERDPRLLFPIHSNKKAMENYLKFDELVIALKACSGIDIRKEMVDEEEQANIMKLMNDTEFQKDSRILMKEIYDFSFKLKKTGEIAKQLAGKLHLFMEKHQSKMMSGTDIKGEELISLLKACLILEFDKAVQVEKFFEIVGYQNFEDISGSGGYLITSFFNTLKLLTQQSP